MGEEGEGEEEEQQQSYEGKCPEVVNSLTKRGEKLNPEKLLGLWKTIYAEQHRQEKSDCWSTKI